MVALLIMRTIKFRAWSLKNKKFYHLDKDNSVFVLDGYYWGWQLGKSGYDWFVDGANSHEGDTLQQFTGLNDKNGHEIYEGDLLAYSSSTLPNYYEVIWNAQAAKFNTKVHLKHDKMLAVRPCPVDKLQYLEIVGNIFENPELLIR